MFDSIKAFQKDKGLEVDGIMKPEGPTLATMNKHLAAADDSASYDNAQLAYNPAATNLLDMIMQRDRARGLVADRCRWGAISIGHSVFRPAGFVLTLLFFKCAVWSVDIALSDRICWLEPTSIRSKLAFIGIPGNQRLTNFHRHRECGCRHL